MAPYQLDIPIRVSQVPREFQCEDLLDLYILFSDMNQIKQKLIGNISSTKFMLSAIASLAYNT